MTDSESRRPVAETKDSARVKAKRMQLWNQAELALTRSLSPEDLRTSGLLAAERGAWSSALLRLEEAVYFGVRDIQTLDALGEAAYRTKAPQALLAYLDLYRDPLIASHMARAMILSGLVNEAREFLNLSRDSILKQALTALLGVQGTIEQSIEAMLKPLSASVAGHQHGAQSDGPQAVPQSELRPRQDLIDTQDDKLEQPFTEPRFEDVNFAEYWQALAPIAVAAKRPDLVALAERRLKALAYDRAVIHFNQSLRLLSEGELKAGWLLYDWRLTPGSPCAGETGFAEISLWEGERLHGKHILVVLENGWGDQIFSLRFIRELIKEGSSVSIAAKTDMQELIRVSFPECRVVDLDAARSSDFWLKYKTNTVDYWTYAFSIPARADLHGYVGRDGYLRADADLASLCRARISEINPEKRPLRGLVWHGDIRTAPMRTRAYSVEEFLEESEILSSPCVLICLQKDVTPEELALLKREASKSGSIVFDASSLLKNFSHTAAWISILDRMWSCDTACAHLAGALNTPTTVLIRNKDIWHWRNSQRGQSDWYSSTKIQDALVPQYSYMFEIRDA